LILAINLLACHFHTYISYIIIFLPIILSQNIISLRRKIKAFLFFNLNFYNFFIPSLKKNPNQNSQKLKNIHLVKLPVSINRQNPKTTKPQNHDFLFGKNTPHPTGSKNIILSPSSPRKKPLQTPNSVICDD